MAILYQIALSILGAVALDWAFHVKIQLIYGATHGGINNTKYRFGPATKIISIFIYLILINIIIFNKMNEPNLFWALFLIALIFYIFIAAYSFIQDQRSKITLNDKIKH